MAQWVKFTEPGRSFAARLSIWKGGQIAFNHGACERFDITTYRFAVLYFASDVPAIGVQLTNDEHAEGSISVSERGTGASVSAKSFLQRFRLDDWRGKNFDLEKDEESGLLVARLEE